MDFSKRTFRNLVTQSNKMIESWYSQKIRGKKIYENKTPSEIKKVFLLEEKNKQCKNGELILMDVGAEYANYSSDMTRTIPVSGRYTKRQKDIYNAVLRVKNNATKMLIAGADWKEYHIEVGKLMTSELLGLGLLDKSDIQNESKEKPAYKKYFMHGTSHHMGLDTHDYGLLDEPMVENMVFTVEPGIYLPEEGFGVRLEDDVVVQNNGEPINLMKDIPIEIEEIEDLMNS